MAVICKSITLFPDCQQKKEEIILCLRFDCDNKNSDNPVLFQFLMSDTFYL